MKIDSTTTAFVTGGAFGIGLAIARSLGERGARVMLADIDAENLESAAMALTKEGIDCATVLCDVADEQQVRAAATATVQRFGKVHIVVNNAGVALGGEPGKISMADWRWIVDINLMGVAHGVEIFTPLIQQHGEGGHIVNVASMAGQVAGPGMGPYHATKFAVVGYSEALQQELAPHNIGISVLCPAWVKTHIHHSSLASPSGKLTKDDPQFDQMNMVIESGLDPAIVGDWTVQSIEEDRLFIFTHPEFAGFIDQRFAAIKADYEACAAHPAFQEND